MAAKTQFLTESIQFAFEYLSVLLVFLFYINNFQFDKHNHILKYFLCYDSRIYNKQNNHQFQH